MNQKNLPHANDEADEIVFVADSILVTLGKYFSPDIQTPEQWYSQRERPNSHVSGETLLLLYMLYHAMLDWIQYKDSPDNRFNQRLADDIPDWVDGKCGSIPFEWVAAALCPNIELNLVKAAMKKWLENPISPSRL